MVVGLGAAELGGQRPERWGCDRVLGLLLGETGRADEERPPVALRGCRQRLVLGRELADVQPSVLFGGDGLVGGELGTDVLEHPEQHRPGGGLDVVARMRAVVGVVGLVGHDVGAVRLPAAGERDIQVFPGHARVHEHMRGVHRDALGPVGGDGVAEVKMLGGVVGGEHDRGAPFAPRTSEGEGAVVSDLGDRPPVAVVHPSSSGTQSAVVVPGDDRIPDRGMGAVVQRDFAAGVHGAVEDQVHAGALVERLDGLVRVGDQHRRPAGLPVVPPRGVGGIDHRLRFTALDAAVVKVGADHFGAAVPQTE